MFECTPYGTWMLNAGLGAGWPGDALAGDDERNMMRGLYGNGDREQAWAIIIAE